MPDNKSDSKLYLGIALIVVLVAGIIIAIVLSVKKYKSTTSSSTTSVSSVSSGSSQEMVHVGRNIWHMKYKPLQRKFRFGLSGTFRKTDQNAFKNTEALQNNDIFTTKLFLFNHPSLSQFEAISSGVPRLDNMSITIPPKWPNVNLAPGNQMCCGCCWAYSLAKTAFARYCIHNSLANTGNHMFSVDAIIACTLNQLGSGDSQPRCEGCNGGDIYSGWDILENHPFQLVNAKFAFQAKNGPASSGNACNKIENCRPPAMLPNAMANCSEDKSAYQCSAWTTPTHQNNLLGSTVSCSPLRTNGKNKLDKYAIIPYWSGSSSSAQQAGSNQEHSNVHPALNNFVFFAAAIQHEIASSGPVQFGMNILDLDTFQNYKPGELILFTQPGSAGGHAMMITGWHWVDVKNAKTQRSISNFGSIARAYGNDLRNPNFKNVYQLVWTIQNQWAEPTRNGWSETNFWGMNNNAHVAGAFYICVDAAGKMNPKVLTVHAQNFMELNAAAGNFWPQTYQ